MGILLCLLTGLFFFIGMICNKLIKDRSKVEVFSVALAFVVLFNLIVFDIASEATYTIKSIFIIFLGLFLLKAMDKVVPHHHHEHKEKNDNKKEHNHHQEHISIITIIALSLHNIIECMVLYSLCENNFKLGLLMALSIAFHNIPLGFQIGSKIENNKLFYTSVLVLSGFCGGIIASFFGLMNPVVENYILCFTLGMLLYLWLFELLPEMIKHKKNKYTLYGIIIGIVLTVITKMI